MIIFIRLVQENWLPSPSAESYEVGSFKLFYCWTTFTNFKIERRNEHTVKVFVKCPVRGILEYQHPRKWAAYSAIAKQFSSVLMI